MAIVGSRRLSGGRALDRQPQEKVLRVMSKESLLCQLKRRFKPTTDSSHPFRTYPNLIKDASVYGSDRAWLSDITYVRLPTSFCYLGLRS
jgi:putative transposase